jgi:hypothetical protein
MQTTQETTAGFKQTIEQSMGRFQTHKALQHKQTNINNIMKSIDELQARINCFEQPEYDLTALTSRERANELGRMNYEVQRLQIKMTRVIESAERELHARWNETIVVLELPFCTPEDRYIHVVGLIQRTNQAISDHRYNMDLHKSALENDNLSLHDANKSRNFIIEYGHKIAIQENRMRKLNATLGPYTKSWLLTDQAMWKVIHNNMDAPMNHNSEQKLTEIIEYLKNRADTIGVIIEHGRKVTTTYHRTRAMMLELSEFGHMSLAIKGIYGASTDTIINGIWR